MPQPGTQAKAGPQTQARDEAGPLPDVEVEVAAGAAAEVAAVGDVESPAAGADEELDQPVFEIPSQAKADDRVIDGAKPRGALSH